MIETIKNAANLVYIVVMLLPIFTILQSLVENYQLFFVRILIFLSHTLKFAYGNPSKFVVI